MAATNYIWTGSHGASWTDVKNWVNSATNKLASAAPGGNSLDTVTINVGASTYPTLSSSVTLASLTINAHGKLTVAAGGSLTAGGAGASAFSNAGLITLSGGKIVASAATGGIANAGVINVTAASSISLGSGGALANTGQLDISAGVLTVTGLIVNSAAINLSGGALTDATAIVNGAAATISGAGALNAAVANSGVIVANGGALTLNRAVTGGALTIGNALADRLNVAATSQVNSIGFAGSLGALSIAAGVTLTDASTLNNNAAITIANGGVLTASAGLINNGVLTAAGAKATINAGSAGLTNAGEVNASGALTVNGPVDNTSAGAIDLASKASLAVVGSALTNAGSIAVAGGSITDAIDLINDGTISGFGVLAAPVDAKSTGTIEATGGRLTLSSAVQAGNLVIGSGGADNLVVAVNSSVAGVSFIDDGGNGALTVNKGVTLTDSGALTNSGKIILSANASLATGGLTTTSTGAITVAAGSSTISGGLTNNGALSVASGGALSLTGAVQNNASLTLAGSASVTSAGALANSGIITIATGKLSDAPELTNSGGITLAGGQIADVNGLLNAGSISGFGAIAASVDASSTGTIEATGGKLTLEGAVHGGALEIGGGAADNLVLAATSAVSSILFANAAGAATLTVNSGVTVTDGRSLAIGSNNLVLNGVLSDASGLSLAGGKISGSGGISGGANITGYGVVTVAITGNETVTASGGTLTLAGLVDQSGAPTSFDIANGATLTFSNSGALGSATVKPSLSFGAGGGSFIDTSARAGDVHLGMINGFSGTDQIELKAFGASDKFAISGNVLTISSGSKTESFTFSSSTAVQYLKVTDSGGVDAITICFMAGTMIRTPEGERAIETLKRGDLVVTTDGVAKKICWLGRQTISSIFADPVRSWPIRIKAGALGENCPSRDLLVSPDHAVLIEGAMIHAGALVNGSSILRETRVPRNFVYYHVELDDHSLIFAENTPAETFIDNAERLAFDNWDEHQKLYPAGKEMQELPYPRAKAPRQVPVRIRIMLARNAQLLGHASSSGVFGAASK